jgi:imidazolonepropionase-like amidohydrolase
VQAVYQRSSLTGSDFTLNGSPRLERLGSPFVDGVGILFPGKLADLVILSGNLLTIPPDAIKDGKVVETIKEGKSIYKQPAA